MWLQIKLFIVMLQRFLLLLLLVSSLTIHAQSTVSTWNLETCINYALQHNIQVQQANIGVESSRIDLLTAKAARMPSLNGAVSQTFSNSKVPTLDNQYVNQSQLSGRYSLSAGLVLFDGNQISKNIQQQRLQVSSDELTVQQTKKFNCCCHYASLSSNFIRQRVGKNGSTDTKRFGSTTETIETTV